MNIPNPGDYVAKLNGRIVVYESESGALCAALPCIIAEGPHAGFTTKATVVLVKNDGTLMPNAIDNMKAVFGWDGIDPFVLMDGDYAETKFKLADCKHENYEGKTSFKPGWVNPLGGGMKMPAPADRRTVLTKYSSQFKALAGGTPVSTAPKTAAPPATKQTPPPPKTAPPMPPSGPTATMEQAWEALCESSPQSDEQALQTIWFSTLSQMFGTENNSELTPHQWGQLKEKFSDNVPA